MNLEKVEETQKRRKERRNNKPLGRWMDGCKRLVLDARKTAAATQIHPPDIHTRRGIYQTTNKRPKREEEDG